MVFAAKCGILVALGSAMTVSHEYDNMAIFNFPMDAGILSKRIHPSLSLDIDQQGLAWVSVLTSNLPKTVIDGIPVPLIKPVELQVRTYVSGPSATGEAVKGVWILGLQLHEPVLPSSPDIIGANTLWSKTIPVAGGKISVAQSESNYVVTASKLELADARGAFSAEAAVSSEPLSISSDFFLKRDAWFGQNGKGVLAVSMLKDQAQETASTGMSVSAFSSSVLRSLSLGEDFNVSSFAEHAESGFFIGRFKATWESSVLLGTSALVV